MFLMKSKTLIYIIGAGRSGTTILDILLGNNNDTIGLGEINRYFKRNGVPPKRDKNDEVYFFWVKIKEKLIQQKFSFDYLNGLFNRNEFHSRIFKSLFKLNEADYKKTLRLHYFEIKNQVDESNLIESSKYPVRALNISNYLSSQEFDIKYIYLKKDPISVVKSFQKQGLEQPAKSFFLANIYYLCVNILCEFVVFILKRRQHKTSTIRYEDLVLSTKDTILKLSNDLEIDLSALENKVANKEELNTGFLFDGNRIRLKKFLILRPLNKRNKRNSKNCFTRIFNYIVYR
jgi:hypothetical protein